jgi:hypothetical protein
MSERRQPTQPGESRIGSGSSPRRLDARSRQLSQTLGQIPGRMMRSDVVSVCGVACVVMPDGRDTIATETPRRATPPRREGRGRTVARRRCRRCWMAGRDENLQVWWRGSIESVRQVMMSAGCTELGARPNALSRMFGQRELFPQIIQRGTDASRGRVSALSRVGSPLPRRPPVPVAPELVLNGRDLVNFRSSLVSLGLPVLAKCYGCALISRFLTSSVGVPVKWASQAPR